METILYVASIIISMVVCLYMFTEIVNGKIKYESAKWSDKVILLLLWSFVFRSLYEEFLRYLS